MTSSSSSCLWQLANLQIAITMHHVNVSMLTVGIHSHRVIKVAETNVDSSRSKHQSDMLIWRPHEATARSHVDSPRIPTREGEGGPRGPLQEGHFTKPYAASLYGIILQIMSQVRVTSHAQPRITIGCRID